MMTTPGATVGTVAYMSPEQVRAEELDTRTDLFAFGSVLYEMATGGTGVSREQHRRDLRSHSEPHSTASPDRESALPPKLEEVIFKALEKEREFRYQTAAELRGDLKRIKRALDTSRARSGVSASSTATLPATLPLAVPSGRSRQAPSGHGIGSRGQR